MKLRVALLLGPDLEMRILRRFIRGGSVRWHCRRAETPEEKEQQGKKIQKEISSYLKGGTRKIPGITGKEKISTILRRVRELKISGEDKLIQRLGKSRYEQIVLGAKTDLIKGWLSLRKARGLEIVPREDLKKIPEEIRKKAEILVFEDKLIRREQGYTRWERVEGGRYWRDLHGRFSKGPSK